MLQPGFSQASNMILLSITPHSPTSRLGGMCPDVPLHTNNTPRRTYSKQATFPYPNCDTLFVDVFNKDVLRHVTMKFCAPYPILVIVKSHGDEDLERQLDGRFQVFAH